MSVPLLPPDTVQVHYGFTVAHAPETTDAALELLSDDEVARAKRFAHERDRRDYVAAHALLRRVLSRHYGRPAREWRFAAGPHGKPSVVPEQVPPGGIALNLTHTHGLVACALAAGTADVGVDAETIAGERTLDIARRFFASAEYDALERCDPADRPARFIETWTLKESIVKAIGTGLGAPLDRFAVLSDGDAGLVLDPPPGEQAERWALALFAPGPSHRLAIAIRGPASHAWRISAIEGDGSGPGALRPVRRSAGAA